MVAPSLALDALETILVKGVSIIKLRLRPQMVKLSLHCKHTRRMRLATDPEDQVLFYQVLDL